MRRVLIVANKTFEVEPLIDVVMGVASRPAGAFITTGVHWPEKADTVVSNPRAELHLKGNRVEIWCIQDLMDPTVKGGASNSSEKARVLANIFGPSEVSPEPAVVIAFGTAATPLNASFNGSVMIGRDVFLHNPYEQTPEESPSTWSAPGLMDRRILSSFPASAFDSLSRFSGPLAAINQRLLTPLGNPATAREAIYDKDGVAVSSVNVVDYMQYTTTDPQSLTAASSAGVAPVISLETTHGIIRAQSDAPFLFFSGITNRVGQYASENQVFPYTQNFVAAHNAAMALAWLLPNIVAAV